MTVNEDVVRLRDYYPQCGWPTLYYGVVPALAQQTGGTTITEIGVAYGYHALDLLRALPMWNYHGIDPYRAGYDDTDPFARDVAALFADRSIQTAMDRLYAAVQESLRPFGSRASLHRQPSIVAALEFADQSTDVIFVDGDHRYDAVVADLVAWWPKLRQGGVFCGDDYLWPEVKKAVDEFAAREKRELRLIGKASSNYPIWVIGK